MTRTRVTVAAPPAQPVGEPLHLRYRPQKFDHVLGQDAVVRSLRDALRTSRPHSFIFTGPSGTGKTTLARIVGDELKCDIVEVDAATNNGIDAMRDLMAPLRYQGFGSNPNKLIIVDEAHGLSKPAWQSLLKMIEEPPPHVFFAFCTTEAGKIPDTIRTRCAAYDLKPLRRDDLLDLLDFVCKEEDYATPDEVIQQIVTACEGSPRMALVMLAMVFDCKDPTEAAVLLSQPLENPELIDLARALVAGKLDWFRLVSTIKAMPEQSPESFRIVMVSYLSACLMGAKSESAAGRLLNMLAEFMPPMNPSDKWAPVLLAFGNIILPE